MTITVALTIVSVLALMFSSTRATGLLLIAVLLCIHPVIYSLALIVGGGIWLYVRFKL